MESAPRANHVIILLLCVRFLQWDKQWVGRKEGAEIRYWSGDSCQLFGGATLYRYNYNSKRTSKWWVCV